MKLEHNTIHKDQINMEACMAHQRTIIAKIKVKIKIKTLKRYKETFPKQKETHQGKADL